MRSHFARVAGLGCITLLMVFAIQRSPAFGQANGASTRVNLWESTPDVVAGNDRDVDPTVPTMDIYLPPADHNTAVGILVLPGGGYTNLSTVREGSDVAKFLVSKGIAAFVVRYRHAPRFHNPIPLQDAQRALRTVRAKATEFHISPDHIGIIGFSAGGHLAACTATMFDAGKPEAADPIDKISSRPDFALLVYPVITLTDEAYVHKGSRTALVGSDDKLFAPLSPEQHVSKETPPTFLVHGSADKTVPAENSIMFYLACHKNGVAAELHILQTGTHGFGLAPTNPALGVWPELMIHWMTANKWLSTVPAN